MEDMKKEIQRLKKQTLYLWVTIINLIISTIFFNFNVIKNYATIRDFYYESLQLDRELNRSLEEFFLNLEENCSKTQ